MPIPIQGEALISAVNYVWGQEGAGSTQFWKDFGAYVYRDSVTSGLESEDGFYDLLVTTGLTFEYKAEFAPRNLQQNYGEILVGPARTERIDGPRVFFNAVRPGGPRERRLREAVQEDFRRWADMLPLIQITSLLVNERISPSHPLLRGDGFVYTRGNTFFSTAHKVNPFEPDSPTFSNKISLAAPIDDTGWATVKDAILQVPDLDGKFLPNAAATMLPRVMVATTTQWLRWARFLGGDSGLVRAQQILQVDSTGNVSISSVMVGDALLTVNPYLLTLAEPANVDMVRKRAFVFTGTGRKPLIWRERVAPVVKTTGPNDWPAHQFNAETAYIQAEATAIFGEPRSLFAVDEP